MAAIGKVLLVCLLIGVFFGMSGCKIDKEYTRNEALSKLKGQEKIFFLENLNGE